MMTDGRWDPGKDFAMVTARETGPTQKFMAIWRASKWVIAQVHGWRAVLRASDYALCADIATASEDAGSGPGYSRMWGAYLTGRAVSTQLAKVKWHFADGPAADRCRPPKPSLINEAVPPERLGASRRRDRQRAGTNPAVSCKPRN